MNKLATIVPVFGIGALVSGVTLITITVVLMDILEVDLRMMHLKK